MIYEVTLFGTYYGQQVINRWNYVSTGTVGTTNGSYGLLKAMGMLLIAGAPGTGTILEAMRPLAVTAMTWQRAIARAASDYDPLDFYEAVYSPSLAGTDTGEGSSPTQAIGFKSNILRTDIRRGYKRFSGVGEGKVSSGGVLVPGAITEVATLATRMSETLTSTDGGGSLSFTPAIVSKEEYAPSLGRVAYRYYATLEEQMEHTAVGVVWQGYDTIRTQTSRQYGRGA